tara:strand:- start:538 stop:789 length:252 start_codon:yes stop_codon:yes gene_type:complete
LFQLANVNAGVLSVELNLYIFPQSQPVNVSSKSISEVCLASIDLIGVVSVKTTLVTLGHRVIPIPSTNPSIFFESIKLAQPVK